ncbi:MAG: hypothetical protein ACLFSQ_06345 [Candidatus Zixiibacteriota bacterium]
MLRYLPKLLKTRINRISFFILALIALGHARANIELFAFSGIEKIDMHDDNFDEYFFSMGPVWQLSVFDGQSYFLTSGGLGFSPSMQKSKDIDDRAGANSFIGSLKLESKYFFLDDVYIGIKGNLDFDNKNSVDLPLKEYPDASGDSVMGYFTTISNSYLELGFLGTNAENDTAYHNLYQVSDRMFGINIGFGGWYYSRWMSSYDLRNMPFVMQATSPVFHTSFESNLFYTLGSMGKLCGFYDKVIGDGHRKNLSIYNLFAIGESFYLSSSFVYDSGKWKEADLDVKWQRINISGHANVNLGYGFLLFAGINSDIGNDTVFDFGIRYSPEGQFHDFRSPRLDNFDHIYFKR